MLAPEDRAALAEQLPPLAARYPKLLFNKGMADALVRPPKNPADCVFSKMSANYSADLETRVEPCVFGGKPDCSQCGCAASGGLHWIRGVRMAGPLKVGHFIQSSVRIGLLSNRLRAREIEPPRWNRDHVPVESEEDLVQIQSSE